MCPSMISHFAFLYRPHTRLMIERTQLHGLAAIASAGLNLGDAQ